MALLLAEAFAADGSLLLALGQWRCLAGPIFQFSLALAAAGLSRYPLL
jgi:hypothetical protein